MFKYKNASYYRFELDLSSCKYNLGSKQLAPDAAVTSAPLQRVTRETGTTPIDLVSRPEGMINDS